MQLWLALLAALALGLIVLAQVLIQTLVLFPSFLSLERAEAIDNLDRSSRAIDREIHHLDGQCADWASWDDTYEYVVSRAPEYVESNLDVTTFVNSRLSVGAIVATDGAVIWHQAVDLAAERVVEMTELPTDRLPPDHPLMALATDQRPLRERAVNGVLMTPRGPLLVAARPILTTDNEGPPRGTLILGRLLTEPYVALLADQTRVAFTATPVPSAPGEVLRELEAAEARGEQNTVTLLSAERLVVRRLLRDVDGEPALVINTIIPRETAVRGQRAARYATVFSVIGGLGIVLVVLVALGQAVVRPLLALTRHVHHIEQSGDLSARLSLGRRDEIGELADAFDRMVARVEEQTQDLERMNHELELLATLDGLTGVANRRRFEDQISIEWRRAQRNGRPLSLIFCDVDHFKKYNDTYGHAAGDECLKAIAKAIRGSARRAGDLVARYGGEEFVMLLADSPLEGALCVAENTRRAVEALAIEHSASSVGHVTLSLGVAAASPGRRAPHGELVEAADRALYASKVGGRNRVTSAAAASADPTPEHAE